MAMLKLIGYDLSDDPTLKLINEERMKNIELGRKQLIGLTGKDFKYDLTIWRDYLIADENHGYTHPYAFEGVDEEVQKAILDEERDRIIAMFSS